MGVTSSVVVVAQQPEFSAANQLNSVDSVLLGAHVQGVCFADFYTRMDPQEPVDRNRNYFAGQNTLSCFVSIPVCADVGDSKKRQIQISWHRITSGTVVRCLILLCRP